MAGFGIETLRSNGTVMMDGSNKAGIFIEAFSIPGGSSSGSQVYMQIPAGSMFVMAAGSEGSPTGNHSYIIGDDGLGHAKLSWTLNSGGYSSNGATKLLIFAKKVTNTDTFGVVTLNDEGDTLMDYTYPVPQYVATLQPAARGIRRYDCADGVTEANEHEVVLDLRTSSNRIVMLNLPDGLDSRIWFSCTSFVPANVGSVTLVLTVIRPYGVPYVVPTLHVFALDGPVSGGGTFGIQYIKSDGSLVYDSSAENISVKDLQEVSYLQGDVTLTMTLPTVAGICIPYCLRYQDVPYNSNAPLSSGFTRIYLGIARRRGSQIDFQLRWVNAPAYYGSFGGQTQYGPGQGFTLAVDISQQNPATVAGIGA
jgi:hypothetical protein